MKRLLRFIALPLVMVSSAGFSLPLKQYPEADRFIQQMAKKHGFEAAELGALLSAAEIKQNILKAIQRPAEAKPWHQYRKIFLTEQRIAEGAKFWQRHQEILERVHHSYGVPPQIIVAILGVETLYGTRTGSFRVLDALATLAFAYPRRADFFRSELEQFLLLSREESMDPRIPQGSYAGAMGWPQFMPSSYRHYAADFDGDGKRDIWHNPGDVIASVANYFSQHGWQAGQPVAKPLPENAGSLANRELKAKFTLPELQARGLPDLPDTDTSLKANVFTLEGESKPETWLGYSNFYVITRYNRSHLYAMAVYQLSEAIKQRREQKVAKR